MFSVSVLHIYMFSVSVLHSCVAQLGCRCGGCVSKVTRKINVYNLRKPLYFKSLATIGWIGRHHVTENKFHKNALCVFK